MSFVAWSAIAPRGCGRLLRRAGLRDVTEAVPGEPQRVGTTEVSAVLAEHDGRRHPFSRARETLAYVVGGPERCSSPGTQISSTRWPMSPAGSTWRSCRSGAGGPVSGVVTWTRSAPHELRRSSIRVWRSRSTGGRSRRREPPGEATPERQARAFAEQVAALAPGVEVRVLHPGGRTDIAPLVRRDRPAGRHVAPALGGQPSLEGGPRRPADDLADQQGLALRKRRRLADSGQ